MSDLVKIRRIKGGSVCECSSEQAEKLAATPQWEYVRKPSAKPAPKTPSSDDE